MPVSRSLSFLLVASVASVASLASFGCTNPSVEGSSADGEEYENEPVAESNDELRSTVSCQESTDTAYTAGRAFSIQVIHIGGKPTTKATGHAFLKMQAAANAVGVNVSISSGFRTQAEQKYFYNCYLTKKCNNGNLAAKPGYSNHQGGYALDLSTSTWLAKNASKFGFARTVPSEPWHYEYHGADPGGPCTHGAEASDGAEATPAEGGLTWVAPKQDTTETNGFTVQTHPNRPGIVKVVYSQGTLDFGSSTTAADDFSLHYTFQFTGDKTLTARGYDEHGTLVAEDNVDFTLTP